ncbi:unnamed protein product [Thlaspi arvense]|uniref:Thioesterase domain-containing protein n=1 Tax=Thlaspi arvense TaxID=13288 RepID=A0AAU9SLL5_THLAR|nr:unnamed protein product [Thlaspi arvense]
MFQATGMAVPTTHVVFPCSWRRILPPRSTKTFKPLACLSLEGVKRMSGFHEIELKVRDYELDQFGVVNNAVYANYCQHGQHEFLESIGINCNEISISGEAMAISELALKFIAPLRSGSKFVIKSRISGTSMTRIYFEQFIFKLPNHEPIVEAKGKAVWLDNKYRPARIPSHIRSNFVLFQRQKLKHTQKPNPPISTSGRGSEFSS